MQGTGGRVVLGFIAGAIAVVIVHQSIVYLLGMAGMTRGVPWNTQPLGYGPFAFIPLLVNTAFWGALWGALFALLYEKLPGEAPWLKGLIYGLLIVVISNWTLLPLIRQYVFSYPPQPLFSNFNPTVMLAVVLIVGGFGLGLGIIYGLMRPKTQTFET
jgi:hypothetical protein